MSTNTCQPSWESDDSVLQIQCGFLRIRVKRCGVETAKINPGYLYVVGGHISHTDYDTAEEAQKEALLYAKSILSKATSELSFYLPDRGEA